MQSLDCLLTVQQRFFLTENIEILSYCLMSVDITIAMCQRTLPFMHLYELKNHVTYVININPT